MPKSKVLGGIWRGVALPAALLLAAEISSWISPWTSDSVAPPGKAMAALAGALADGSLLASTSQTLAAALAGCLIGVAIGFAVGCAMGLLHGLGMALDLSIELARPIPSIALIPVAMLIFGLGFRLEISVVAFACVWPMLVLSRAAIGSVEKQLLELARTLELTPLARVTKIVLPATMPQLFVALRISVGIALIVAITVEIAANPIGLGYDMMMAQQTLRPDLMYGLLAWIAVLGWGINMLMLRLERIVTRERAREVRP